MCQTGSAAMYNCVGCSNWAMPVDSNQQSHARREWGYGTGENYPTKKIILILNIKWVFRLSKQKHNDPFILQNIWVKHTHVLKWRTTFYTQKNEKKLYYTVGMNVVVSLKLSMNNISERKFTYNALIFDWARGKVFNWDNQKNQAFDATNLISTILHSLNSCHGIGMFMTFERITLVSILLIICQRNGACFLIDSSKKIFWNRHL